MDTSETYIRMFEKAEEIQIEDFIPHILTSAYAPPLFISGQADFYIKREGIYIWLPRQDQLQEMLGDDFSNLPYSSNAFGMILSFLCFCSAGDDVCTHGGVSQNEYTLQFTSMEQLWLAFVMKEKYDKSWNDEQWI